MATYKIPSQNLSAWIPDEGVPYYSDWTKRSVHLRQGKTIYTLPSSQYQGQALQTAPDNQEGLQWLGVNYQQGTPDIFKSVAPKTGEILTQTISPFNPHGVDITSNLAGVVAKSPSLAENLARAGATPEQIKSLSASAEANKGGAYTPEQLKVAGVTPPTPTPFPTPDKQTILDTASKTLSDLQNRIATEGVTDASGKILIAPTKTPVSDQTPAVNMQQEVAKMDEQINTAGQQEAETLSGTKIDVKDSSALISKLIETEKDKPTIPSLSEQLSAKRASLGLDTLETQLNEADAQIAKLEADYHAVEAEEGGRLVSMGQIRKRQSALGIEYTKKRGELQTQRTNVANQLNMKYGALETFMKFTGQDYENANKSYQQKFNNAITMSNLMRGIEEDQKTEQERAKDNARANVDIMYDLIKSGQVNYDLLPKTTQMDIRNMELRSGLPAGFVSALKKVSVGKEILFHRATPDETGEIVYYKDGTSQVITFPGVSPKPKPITEGEKKTALQKQMAEVISGRKDKSGKISSVNWNTLRAAWVQEGGTAKDFDSNFGQYIDKSKESEYYVEKNTGNATITF